MTILLAVFSACAVGIILYTFRIGSRLEETNRRIAELRERIGPDDSAS